MAEFDLGSLYQKLKLDISEFMAGIQRAISDVGVLRSELETVSRLKFNIQTGDASKQMEAFSIEAEKAKATYAAFLDNYVKGRLRMSQVDQQITPANYKETLQREFVDLDEYLGIAVDKTKAAQSAITRVTASESGKRLIIQQDSDARIIQSLRDRLASTLRLVRSALREQSLAGAHAVKIVRPEDVELLEKLRAKVNEFTSLIRKKSELSTSGRDAEIASLQKIEAEDIRSLSKRIDHVRNYVKERRKLFESNIQSELKTSAAFDVATKQKSATREAVDDYNRWMEEVFRDSKRATTGDIQRLNTWKEEMIKAGKVVDERTMSVAEGARSRWTRLLAEMVRRFSDVKDVGTATFGGLASGILKSAAGFAIAMATTRLLTGAVQSLISVVQAATTNIRKLESQAIQMARSFTTSGQRSADQFSATVNDMRGALTTLRRMAAEMALNPDEMMLMTQRLMEMGHGFRVAAKGAQLLNAVSQTAYGESSQYWVLQQEMIDLFTGKLENAKFIVNQIGAEAAEAVRELARAGDFEQAADLLAEKLGISVQFLKEAANQLGAFESRLAAAFEESTKNTVAAQAWGAAYKFALQSITDDLKNHGVIWVAIQMTLLGVASTVTLITGVINSAKFVLDVVFRIISNITAKTYNWLTATIDLGKFWEATRGLFAGIPSILGDIVSKMVDMLPFSEKIRAAWERIASAAATLKSFVWDIPEPPIDVSGVVDNEAKRRQIAAQALDAHNLKIEEFLKVSKEQLEVEQAAVELKKAQAQFGADAVARASAELSAAKQDNALQARILQHHNQMLEMKKQLTLEAGKLTRAEEAKINQEIESNNQQLKRLGIETKIAAVRAEEEIIMGRLARIQANTSNAQELHNAAMLMQSARLQQMKASEIDLERQQAAAKQINLNIERQGIEMEIALRQQSGLTRDLDYQRLIARKQAIGIEKDALRITTDIKTQQIALNQELERQSSLYERISRGINIAAAAVRGQAEIAAIMRRATTRIRAPIDEEISERREQLDIEEKLARIERQLIDNSLQRLSVEYGLKVAKAGSAEEVANIVREYQGHLDQLAEGLVLWDQSLQKIQAQRSEIDKIEIRRLNEQLATSAKSVASSFLEAMRHGELHVKDFLRGLSESFFQRFAGYSLDRMITDLVSKLEVGIESVAEKLASAFGGSGGFWGSILNGMIAVGLAAVSSLFNEMEAEVESLADEAKGTIEDVERQRGLIAGEQSIAIAKISEELSRALLPTNSILSQILNQLKLMSGQSVTPVTAGSPPGYSVAYEVIGSSRI
ncbi:MAG TPA: hypothetical protein VNP04_13620 [Alphaproteobacteria bacterium]|nr:hypothetical protein [Alphaproteobacteria bacterium]